MAPGTNRVLYVGTEDGLYLTEEKGKEYQSRPLGLHGKGAMRSPVVIDRDNRQRIYAVTARGGVQRSEDGGQSWQEINNGILYKETWCIVQHPKTGEVVVGTGPSSVFKSVDGGDSWVDCERLRDLPETIDWTFPRPPHVSHVKGLALRLDNPMLIFGAVEEGWVIRSQDGGTSWQNIKDGVEFDAHSVAVMPDNPEIVIATSGQGVYKSTNGGDSFVNSSHRDWTAVTWRSWSAILRGPKCFLRRRPRFHRLFGGGPREPHPPFIVVRTKGNLGKDFQEDYRAISKRRLAQQPATQRNRTRSSSA
jgi:photosystem II stability/assembly factor-like uncharacterized protein